MSANNTREKILDAAEALFMEKGYEAASVKMILNDSGAVAGSFYHFFSSKEELFEQVVSRFMKRHEERVSEVFEKDEDIDAQINEVLALTSKALAQYSALMKQNRLHWTMQEALHNCTVKAMIPPLAESLKRKKERNEISFALNASEEIIAAMIIKGTEAVLHTETDMNMKERHELIASYVHMHIKKGINKGVQPD